MNLWKPVDWQGQLIYKLWTHLWQVRTGVVVTDLALVLIFGKKWLAPEEQLFIYQMSAWALLIGGVGIIVTAMLALQSTDTAEDVDDLVKQHEEPNPEDEAS